MSRVSPGQMALLEKAGRNGLITKAIPEYWDPKPSVNGQIDRLVARGFLRPDGTSFFRLTEAGLSKIGLVKCEACNCATHPDEAACMHCGKMKSWAA
jgi:hypothetical protein